MNTCFNCRKRVGKFVKFCPECWEVVSNNEAAKERQREFQIIGNLHYCDLEVDDNAY